jgi:hypothetical protein
MAIYLPTHGVEMPNWFSVGSISGLIFAVLLFACSLLSMSMTISSLFTDSKLSAQVGPLMLLFPSSIAMAIVVSKLAPNMEILANNKVMEECCLVGSTCCDPDYIPQEIKSADAIYCGYFIPHFPFTVAMLDFFFEDGAKNLLGLSSSVAYMCLGICSVFYYFLYEYLDAIIPNAYGIKKGCCCCLTYCRKKKVTFDEVDDQLEEMGMNKKHNESLISEHR